MADQPRPEPASGKIRNPLMFKKLEDEICELEARLETVRSGMMSEENYTNHENMLALQAQEKDITSSLAEAYDRWENW